MRELGPRWSRRFTRPAILGASVAAVVAAAGCGGSGGSGSGPTSTISSASAGSAARVVAAARSPLASFNGPSQSPGRVPAGKSIAVIYPLPAPLPNDASAGVVNAAKAIGWKTHLINGKGTPSGYVDAINQAISEHVDGIVLVAMPVDVLAKQIQAANKAGIPVVSALPGLPAPESPSKFGLFDYVRADYDAQGRTLADWVIQAAPHGAQVIRLESPEFSDLTHESKVFEQTLEAAGPTYKVVDVVSSPVTDILGGPQGVQRLAASLRRHPQAKFVFILSESWAQIFLQAQKLTGRTDVTGLGSDGDASVPLVAKGEKLVMMGPDSKTYGWYAIDGMIRAFNRKPAVQYKIQSQLVDPTNAKSVKGAGITATYDYAADWKRLWGLGS